MEEDEQFVLEVKNLDDNSTILYSAGNTADIPYTSIARNEELCGSIWASYWSEVKQIEEEMWDAVQSGSLEKLMEIFERKTEIPVQINSESLDRWTALHYACYGGYDKIVAYLLMKGANSEAKTSINRSGLHLACIKQHTEVVRVLLLNEADPNCQDDDLCTPLHYAAIYGYEEIVKLFLRERHRLDLQLKNHQGMTASDCSLNGNIFKLFGEAEEDNYSRTMLGGMMRRSSRADHVEKLLSTAASLRKHHSESTETSEQNSEKKLEKRRNKFEKISMQQPSRLTIESEEGSKLSLGKFEILELLGKGSFGEVYLVRKKGEEQLYAMKSLLKSKIKSQNLTKYVMTERDVLTLMNNPFIVQIYGAFQNKDKLYLVLEYCPGGDLEKKIIRQKKIPEEIVKMYAAEITIAIESLHKRQIIFRDLKPANVVLDSAGHAKITDFGLAIKSKQSKSFCGSIAYLAPEMLFKKRHGFTLDWYLLGVLIYELLEGMPPYYCLNKQRLFENIKHQKLTLPKNITKECQSILTKLLERDPQKRLGASHDARDIKEHPWFGGYNWEDVYNRYEQVNCRKLTPPPIKERMMAARKLEFQVDEEDQSDTKLNGWSFVKLQ